MYKEALRAKDILAKQRVKVKRQLSRLPSEQFVCYDSPKGYYRCYAIHKIDGKRVKKYIPKKDRKYAERLAQHAYLKKRLEDIDNEIEAIDRYLRKHKEVGAAEKFANKNPFYLELIKPLFKIAEDSIREWATNYKKLNYKIENLKYKALDGNYYRSKSESIIATRLYERAIPFRYECALDLTDGRTVYPDFIIMNPKTGEIFIWEHLGMMDIPSYFESNIMKIAEYANSGYVLNKDLIITIEDENSHLDIEEIDRIIDSQILGLAV